MNDMKVELIISISITSMQCKSQYAQLSFIPLSLSLFLPREYEVVCAVVVFAAVVACDSQ